MFEMSKTQFYLARQTLGLQIDSNLWKAEKLGTRRKKISELETTLSCEKIKNILGYKSGSLPWFWYGTRASLYGSYKERYFPKY